MTSPDNFFFLSIIEEISKKLSHKREYTLGGTRVSGEDDVNASSATGKVTF